MNQLMQGKQLTVFGDGSQTRAFSHIDDVAPCIANSVNHPNAYNQIFNIGADKEYSVNELATATMEAMHIKGEIRHLAARNEVMHAFSDHTKVKRIFSQGHSKSLQDGLRDMAKWAKDAGIRKSKKFKDIEITEKLPPVWLED